MEKEETKTKVASEEMTNRQRGIYKVESFLEQNYEFRRNVLSGKTEVRQLTENALWDVLTTEALNSIIRQAKKEDVGEGKSPKQDIEEYVCSDAVPAFDPIGAYLTGLPKWDGKNHVAELFGRIPGLNSEQLGWCATWLRSTVAHWLDLDHQHGNESVPVLIGEQGCGKSTFAVRLLPEELRRYYLDHINFGNKFDSEMALTHNLLVNIDEFANMGVSQQGKLKQTLSKVKVNGRPIFGRSQEDRRRFASFLATTNEEHPLCDQTGSRRYICLHIPAGQLIDNQSPISYEQLYAQVLYELKEKRIPYWFSNLEVARIQQANLPYFREGDLESMIGHCFRLPEKTEEASWLKCQEVLDVLKEHFPLLKSGSGIKIRIGQALKMLGCLWKHTKQGQVYQVVPL